MRRFLSDFITDERGAAAAEYVLLLGLITTGIAVAVITLGDEIAASMNEASSCIKNADAASCGGTVTP